jgi:hypothetical protein
VEVVVGDRVSVTLGVNVGVAVEEKVKECVCVLVGVKDFVRDTDDVLV